MKVFKIAQYLKISQKNKAGERHTFSLRETNLFNYLG